MVLNEIIRRLVTNLVQPPTACEHCEKALPIIKERWAVDQPLPLRRIPILIGGGGEKSDAADHSRTCRHLAWFLARLRTLSARMQSSINGAPKLAVTRQTIERSVSPRAGEPIEPYLEAGATHIIIGMGEPWDFAPVEALLKLRR
jgi:hypothetical protein